MARLVCTSLKGATKAKLVLEKPFGMLAYTPADGKVDRVLASDVLSRNTRALFLAARVCLGVVSGLWSECFWLRIVSVVVDGSATAHGEGPLMMSSTHTHGQGSKCKARSLSRLLAAP